jgi:adenylate cyclase
MSLPYYLIHPLFSVLVVLLILITFGTKIGQHKRRNLHYIAGLAAFICAIIAVTIASSSIRRSFRESGGNFQPAEAMPLHELIALAMLAILGIQTVMGLLMYFNVRWIGRLLTYHRLLGRLMLVLLMGLAIFGALTVREAVNEGLEQVLVFVALIAVLAITGTLLALETRRSALGRRRHHTAVRHIELKPQDVPTAGLHIHYLPDDIKVATQPDKTILTTSLEAGISHTHVCGGNARCSTCRIAVLEGLEHCQPRNSLESVLADRLSFPPNIRLACQTQFTGDIKVRRLVLDDDDIQITSQIRTGAKPGSIGEEKHVAILFADIRGFTSFSEALPPYDVIHALNRYYQQMDLAIQQYGGHIDNYMGDGLMALFDGDQAQEVVLRSIKAGLGMLDGLAQLRPYFQDTYAKTLDIGIGLHYGQVVLGNLGSPRSKRITVIGDSVNFASRIESANKEAGTRFLISDDTYEYVKDAVQIGKTIRVSVKGKTGEHDLYEVTGLTAPETTLATVAAKA